MKKILYTGYRSWGNEIDFFNAEHTKISGWYPEKFDNGSILINNPKDKESELFIINNIRFCEDPTDMFFADVKSLGNISKELIYGNSDKLHKYIFNKIGYKEPNKIISFLTSDNNFMITVKTIFCGLILPIGIGLLMYFLNR